MCWLVMVGVRGYHGDPKKVFSAHAYRAAAATNPVCAAMGADAVKLAVTDGHCACSLYIETLRREPGNPDRLRARYRRKGWSAAKIERAMAVSAAQSEKLAAAK